MDDKGVRPDGVGLQRDIVSFVNNVNNTNVNGRGMVREKRTVDGVAPMYCNSRSSLVGLSLGDVICPKEHLRDWYGKGGAHVHKHAWSITCH